MKNTRAKRAKILFFIVKYANLWGFRSLIATNDQTAMESANVAYAYVHISSENQALVVKV